MEKNTKDIEFEHIINRLNEAQYEAVSHTEGPVMVIAGPGTGKTQIIGARIGNILREGLCEPHNIMCLTYTDAGSVAMRQRLTEFIGPTAYEVRIYTFHAFCNDVIRENSDAFGGWRDLSLVDDLEKNEIIEQLIHHLPPENPLRKLTGDIYSDKYRLLSLFSTMKRENWLPGYIIAQCDKYLEECLESDDFRYKKKTKNNNPGDLKLAEFNAVKDKMEKLKAAAATFDLYQAEMAERKRFDYDDMLLWVLNAFKKNPNLLLDYQERYQYMLVDEYQDTNGTQNEILMLLCSYWDEPNVFVVGDDDQAIYRFQGANVGNILHFQKQYNPVEIILTENYRSTQPILDAAAKVIANNKERLVNVESGIQKKLTASGAFASLQNTPNVYSFDNYTHEISWIKEEIKRLIASGVKPAEIAVLYPKHKHAEELVKLLQAENIPFDLSRNINAFDLLPIRHLINILNWLNLEYQNEYSGEHLLFEIMHYRYFGISIRDINRIAVFCKYKPDEPVKKWRDVVGNESALRQAGLNDPANVLRMSDLLEGWIADIANHTIQILFEKILTESGIFDFYLGGREQIDSVQIIKVLFDFIKSKAEKKEGFKLADLMDAIGKMMENNISLNYQRVITDGEGIRLVTAHGSKGLEYEYVFMINGIHGSWNAKRSGYSEFSLPPTLFPSNYTDDKDEDDRRLFFVAMTRAKKQLYITYSINSLEGKPQNCSKFITELIADGALNIERVEVSSEILYKDLAWIMTLPVISEGMLLETHFLEKELESFELNVTALNKYLQCPIAFYYENILKIPTAQSATLAYGSAVHYGMEIFMKKAIKEKTWPYNEETLLKSMTDGLLRQKHNFTDQQFSDYSRNLERVIPLYFAANAIKWKSPAELLIEHTIQNVQWNGVPLKGKLDKIEISEGAINVVDYKTGKPEYGLKKLKPPTEKDPTGGDYWRQIVFYNILLLADKRFPSRFISGEMEFIQPENEDQFVSRKHIVAQEEIELVTTQIEESYRHIMDKRFSPGCGTGDCFWCNFVKDINEGRDPIRESGLPPREEE